MKSVICELKKRMPDLEKLYVEMHPSDDGFEGTTEHLAQIEKSVSTTSQELSQLQSQIQVKVKENQKNGVVTDDQWESSMSWIVAPREEE